MAKVETIKITGGVIVRTVEPGTGRVLSATMVLDNGERRDLVTAPLKPAKVKLPLAVSVPKLVAVAAGAGALVAAAIEAGTRLLA